MEPLAFFLKEYNFDLDKIEKISSGEKYTAILLKNGNIGVCANLGHKVGTQKTFFVKIDLLNFPHRIVLSAYFAALLNYENQYQEDADIFDIVNFKSYRQLTMLGYFKPLLEKFDEAGIGINIFDLRSQDGRILKQSELAQKLARADALILTSTSIFNNTFLPTLEATNINCDIFLLGPSSIMSQQMFRYPNLTSISGTTFENADERVLKIIAENGGTRSFSKFGKKRNFKRK
jgi:uncharacterized protein (DUF4213/DUF364 family)